MPSEQPPEPQHFHEGEEVAPPGVRVMAIVRWLLVAIMAAAAAASIAYVAREPGRAETRAAEYYCPMHPAVVQAQPGECPICGMSLVAREPGAQPAAADHSAHAPRAAGDHAGHAPGASAAAPPAGLDVVELPAERVQLIGMRTAQVARVSMPARLSAVGYVAPTESGVALVETRFSGWIEELHVAQTGQLVQRGQLLGRVFSPDLLSAQQELLNARTWQGDSAASLGPGIAESARTRLELLGMLPSEIAEVERSGAPHRLIELRSPARGYVTQKEAVQGLFVQPGTRLFEIADLSKVWVFVELFERDAGRVRAGLPASLQLTAYPGETFRGQLQLIYPMLSPETRTQRARVEFANPGLRLRPGMFGEVTIELAPQQGLVVPREAVVDTGEHQYVFVAEGAGRFVPRAVRLGARLDEQVQVLEGLEAGERVVTTGNFLLDSESRLRATVAAHQH